MQMTDISHFMEEETEYCWDVGHIDMLQHIWLYGNDV